MNWLKNILLEKQGPLTKQLTKVQGVKDLGLIPQAQAPEKTTSLVCGYCSTGCNLEVHQREGQAVNLTPKKSHPVNLGKACPKGWQALAPVQAIDRATGPLIRNQQGKFTPLSWPSALDLFHDKMKAIQEEHGPESVAFLSTGQITTEEMALLGSLTKFGMGITQGDGNTRQCMATSAVAYKQSFGFDSPPFSYEDLQESDVMVFIGANPCINHPILWKHVLANPHQPKIIVLDPRKTKTAQAATHHYPLKPKSDLILLYALAKLLIQQGWIDPEYIQASTKGFEEFSSLVGQIQLAEVSEQTGLKMAEIAQLAHLIHEGKKVSFWWTMGVNQGHQAVLTAQAIINLALMTGNMGRPGTGANSITGQCNAMGSRLFSNTTNLLGGHDFADPKARSKVAGILGIEEASIPTEASLPYHQILEQVQEGKIKALWVIATNPAHSWIDLKQWEEVVKKLDFLVVQDMYSDTKTAQGADLFLSAGAWGEKEGIMINSERRLSKLNPIAQPPGSAKTDFDIFLSIAQAFNLTWVEKAFGSPKIAFQTLQKLSKNQACDISGIENYQEIERAGGIQWPYGSGKNNPRRLFAEGQFFHPDKKAKFCFGPVVQPPQLADEQYPFILLTGRGSSTQWHTGTRTDRSKLLAKMSPKEIYVEISPSTAENFHILEGDLVSISSRQGSIQARAVLTQQVGDENLFIPMHYPELNQLLAPVFDPQSHQPSYKFTPVKLHIASL